MGIKYLTLNSQTNFILVNSLVIEKFLVLLRSNFYVLIIN